MSASEIGVVALTCAQIGFRETQLQLNALTTRSCQSFPGEGRDKSQGFEASPGGGSAVRPPERRQLWQNFASTEHLVPFPAMTGKHWGFSSPGPMQ